MKKFLTIITILITVNSYAITTTWNGQVSNEWHNNSNWSNGVPNNTTDVIIGSGPNNVYVGSSASCRKIEILQTGLIEVGTGITLNIYGDIVNDGFFDAAAAKINFAGVSHISDGLYFNDLSINGTLYAPNFITVKGAWENNGIFINGMGTVSFGGQSSITGTSITSFYNVYIVGQLTSHPIAINVKGNLLNDGTFYHNNGVVVMNGNANQSIWGTTLYSLVINNLNYGTCMVSDVIIKNKLSLVNGYLYLYTHTLTIDNNDPSSIERDNGFILSETIPASGYGFIKWVVGAGKGKYVYPFSSDEYIPVTLEIRQQGINNYASVSIATYKTDDDNNPYPTGVTSMEDSVGDDMSLQTVNRFWITKVDGYNISPNSTISFTASDTEIGLNDTLIVSKWDGINWVSASDCQEHIGHGARVQNIRDYTIFSMVDEFSIYSRPNITNYVTNRIKVYLTTNQNNNSIDINNVVGPTFIQMIDIQGRMVINRTINEDTNIPFTDMTHGVYIIKIVSQGQIYSKRIII